MRLFVTVGTTAFDELIESVDNLFSDKNTHEINYQIANGLYKPLSGNYFNFQPEIEKYYINSDVIITHAGAGSIYHLLKLRKKIIIVPNFNRIDQHQSDISSFMEKNKYSLVCWDLNNIKNIIDEIQNFTPREYTYNSFFMYDEISSYIKGLK
ncbi:hypothetical protein M0K80_RS21505 [Providencia rettgeri]|nr:hypothetical protein [Providencia rettgeri]EJD6411266.1 hypothetical protein [Providencia rettgeri]EJD6673423.1 hypothetical protein [Providencia rettgeri]ELR5127306.1 hypothetical protein [Providencia rettgeri]ELR5135610.1 hypothetical protein [Providencia rettgeri]